MRKTFIANFEPLTPPYSQAQGATLDWVIMAHIDAESRHQNKSTQDLDALKDEIASNLLKIGLGPQKIQKRNLYFKDFLSLDHHQRQIYDFDAASQGALLSTRMGLYDSITSKVLADLYKDKTAPSHLIHTTCTGYSSPSCAQKLISMKQWGQKTQLIHAYHMGCYASIPSIRIAKALVESGSQSCDIVHTEFCSLHMNPLDHSISQLVIESLFADGAIFYNVCDQKPDHSACLEIINIKEEIVPDSLHGMSWQPGPYGFSMSLSKDVPALIARHLEPFIDRLFTEAKIMPDQEVIYAIHPGGPKIIDYVAKRLNLDLKQYIYSQTILKEHGNMSSATLPHVWDLILKDQNLKEGQNVVSLAFGPGLTIAGALCKIRKGIV